MIVAGREILEECIRTKSAVPAFNIYNLETAQAALSVATQYNSPVFLAFGEKYLDGVDFYTISAMVKSLATLHKIPVCLHLDHCTSFNHIKEAIDAGFTSVMYDGSSLSLSENIENTLVVVRYAHEKGVSVEAEIGGMNSETGTDGVSPNQLRYTVPAEAKELVEKTKVDSLAVSVGNAHGLYKDSPHLNIQRIKEIYDSTRIPLVLHGSSGIPFDQIKKAIQSGIAKINVNTELAVAGAEACKKTAAQRLEIIMTEVKKAVIEAAKPYMKICDSFPY